MLNNIPRVLSPQLLAALAEMGHADTIVLGDANFPARTCTKANDAVYIRLDGVGVTELLKAILQLMPLDYSAKPAMLMQPDRDVDVPIWQDFYKALKQADDRGEDMVEQLARNDFYAAAKKAFCVVQTGETAIYANIILQKGVVE